MTGQMKEESDATASAPSELAQVTPSDRLTGTTACEREASATASLLRHVMQIGPARPVAPLTEAGGQSKDMQSADRHYPLQANNSSSNSNGWREHASMLSVVVILLTNMRYY